LIGASIISATLLLIYLTVLGIGIWAFILFIRLATRGIKALDIYISKNSSNNT